MLVKSLAHYKHPGNFPFWIQRNRHDQRSMPLVHTHDFVELIYVECGQATHLFQDTSYEISQGDIFMINPGEKHGYVACESLRCMPEGGEATAIASGAVADEELLLGFGDDGQGSVRDYAGELVESCGRRLAAAPAPRLLLVHQPNEAPWLEGFGGMGQRPGTHLHDAPNPDARSGTRIARPPCPADDGLCASAGRLRRAPGDPAGTGYRGVRTEAEAFFTAGREANQCASVLLEPAVQTACRAAVLQLRFDAADEQGAVVSGIRHEVYEAAAESGYRDTSHFSRVFAKYWGSPPETYKPSRRS